MAYQQPQKLIAKLAALLRKENGSDIIINANSHPAVKIDGNIRYITDIMFSSDDTLSIAQSLLTEHQWAAFEQSNEMNLLLEYSGVAHLRTNLFRQRGEVGLVFRMIPLEIPSIEELLLPQILKEFSLRKRGLILFSGATGVGKSTSLAAMLDYRNEKTAGHIITVEDPIEFLHANKKSVVSQREVGIDTESYRIAMKSALRQAPDVLLVGEIRDAEVMQQALAFAKTGHLVLATVHATTTKLTLERIVNFFPHESRAQLLHDLSSSLQAIVSQRLLQHASGKGRVVACEVMSNKPFIAQLIREARFLELDEAIMRGTLKEGIISIDNYIFDLYENGLVTYDEALNFVSSKTNFRLKIRAESSRLPEELKSDEKEWGIERAISDETRQKVWGSFSKT